MRFHKTALPDAYLIEPDLAEDERGFFARVYCEREFSDQGLDGRFVQCSISYNRRRGTVRGMHYQVRPYEEAKLVRCTRGAIYDVIVDLRPRSLAYMKWVAVEISSENRLSVFVPRGFAHGFQTMMDDTEIFYQIDEFWRPGAARGFRWNDAAFGISWPLPASVISEQDKTFPDFSTGLLE